MSVNQTTSLEYERRVLAYMFSDKKYISLAMTRLKSEHMKETRILFQMLVGYFNAYKDVISRTVIEDQFRSKKLESNKAIQLLTVVDEVQRVNVLNEGDYHYAEDQVIEQYKRRKLVDIAKTVVDGQVTTCSSEELAKISNNVQTTLTTLNSTDFDVKNEGSISGDAKERLDRYRQIKANPETLKLIKTGFKSFDKANGGMRPGELAYVIGRKGDGKSVCLINLGHNMWRQNYNIIFYSLEISKEDYQRRFDSRAALVSAGGLKLGTLDENEEREFFNYIENLAENKSPTGQPVGNVYVVDVPSRCTPAYIETKTAEVEQKLGITFDVVIVDYSEIMAPNVVTELKRDNLGEIALSLKQYARESMKLVITAAQMTRSGKQETSTKNGHAGTEHIAESDQVANHIDWGFAIRSVSEDAGIVETFKTRDGEPIQFRFNKRFDQMNIIEQDESEWAAVEVAK